jgi:simple sugar transport system ATP-binding protein
MTRHGPSSEAGADPQGSAPATATPQAGAETLVALRGLTKRFGELTAVDAVDLELRRGEVHALLGENGAGKTTLMSILAGFLVPDEGQILIDGKPVAFTAPRDAIEMGIGMVHQHFRLVEKFTVAENLALGDREVPQLLDGRILDTRVRDWCEQFGLDIDPEAAIWQLSIGEQQRVEVLRALARGAQLLVLDEPTSVLTPQESDALCRTLREMAAGGKTVVFISHKLNEVMAVADRVTVMRAGRGLQTFERSECNPEMLVQLMVGKNAPSVRRDDVPSGELGRPVIRLNAISALDHRGLEALRDVSLTVHSGEIVGIAGVAGNGQAELADVITGARSPSKGAVTIDGADMARKKPRAFIRQGLAYIPDDRRGTGLVPSQPIWRNAILKSYRDAPISRGVVIDTGRAKRFAEGLAEQVDLSTRDVNTPVEHLSGGNAQKLLAGRELGEGNSAVVAVNPTQGLDVGAAADVARALLAARARGMGVLLISHDLDELLRLSDRIAVLYEGRIAGEFESEQADRKRIGMVMGGMGGNENVH